MARKAPSISIRRAPSRSECCNCGKVVGAKAGVFPVFTAAADGYDKETWCPSCFRDKRIPLEPGRWDFAVVVHCGYCGREGLSTNAIPKCPACRRHAAIIMPGVGIQF